MAGHRHGERARAPPARQGRGRPGEAVSHPHRARRRLPLRPVATPRCVADAYHVERRNLVRCAVRRRRRGRGGRRRGARRGGAAWPRAARRAATASPRARTPTRRARVRRRRARDACREVGAAHHRHDDVGHQQVDGAGGALEQRDGGVAVGRDDHVVARTPQDLGDQGPHLGLVVDDEHGRACRRSAEVEDLVRRPSAPRPGGERDRERGAAARAGCRPRWCRRRRARCRRWWTGRARCRSPAAWW